MDYYKQYMVNYLSMDDAMQLRAKLHWTRCHLNNIASGRQDLIIFSAQILKAIESADEILSSRAANAYA